MSIFEKLAAPFSPGVVSWRVGATNKDKTSGLALAYIDARDVMQRLDDVVGPGNWQCRYSHATTKTVCDIGIRIDGEWIWKANGAGDTDTEAEKGALSDAFKRTAVLWGIGRYLYDVDSPWVTIEPYGKSYKIAQGEYAKLRRALGSKEPVKTAPPAPLLPPVHENTKAGSREIFDELVKEVRGHASLASLTKWKTMQANIDRMENLNDAFKDLFVNEFADHVKSLKKGLAA